MGCGYGIGGEQLKQVSQSDRWLSVLGEEGNEHSVTAPVVCMHANTGVCMSYLTLNILNSPARQGLALCQL